MYQFLHFYIEIFNRLKGDLLGINIIYILNSSQSLYMTLTLESTATDVVACLIAIFASTPIIAIHFSY